VLFLNFRPSNDFEEQLSELNFPVWCEFVPSEGQSGACVQLTEVSLSGLINLVGNELLSAFLEMSDTCEISLKSNLNPSFSSVILDRIICLGF
jgi:hypothetical protein